MNAPQVTAADLMSDGDAAAADPVLRSLRDAEDAYRSVLAAWGRDAADARQARDALAAAREDARRAADELAEARAELDAERKKAARLRDAAGRLAAALKDVHRAALGGNVFELILRACLTLTGATRGLYVTAWRDGRLRARAAAGVGGYPRKQPSAFVRALCERAAADRETFVANDPAGLRDLPEPDGAAEAFRNCLAAPAVLLKESDGVVVLADKPGGFDRADAELVMSVGDQAGVAVENRLLQDELVRAYFSVVGVLADAIEAKDPYTKGHCEMVARLARRTAAKLADDPGLHGLAGYGGLLHDVGKIGVSDGVLNKPGRLTPEEWVLMQSHARVGRDLVANVPALGGVAGVVLSHHEWYDGSGYPDGLSGEDIPLAARVVAVADAYSAMVSKRSYRESLSPDEARRELERGRGTQFDPRVVDAFLAVLDEPGDPDSEPEDPGDFRHILVAGRPPGREPAGSPCSGPFPAESAG